MFKKYHLLFMGIFYALDISFTLLALLVADLFFTFSLAASQAGGAVQVFDRSAYLLVIIIWTISFRIFPIYSSKRAETLGYELATVTIAAIFSWFLFVGCLFLFGYPETARIPAIFFGVLDLALLIPFHISLRVLLRFLRLRGYNLKKVLIIGGGQLGRQVAAVLQDRPWTGYQIIGFLDNDPLLAGKKILSIPVLGKFEQVRSVVEDLEVDDEVIIALPTHQQHFAKKMIASIEDIPVNVRMTPDLCDIEYIRPHVEDLWGIPLIGIRQAGLTGPYALLKRAIDITGALLGMLVCAPLCFVVSILIRMDSPGPVIFVQERVGENGRKFRIYKFRTMVANSEELLKDLIDLDALEEPVFKLKDDPRVTKLGRFLRRTSIDEIPQLINVIKGEMSLVGPRPEETKIVQRYSSWHRKRLMAKPGMTGPAQVTGRSDLPLNVRVEMEINYIKNSSLLTDLEILVKTIPVVIKGNGCY